MSFESARMPGTRWGKKHQAFGLSKQLKEWARLFGLTYTQLYSKLKGPSVPTIDPVTLLEGILRSIVQSGFRGDPSHPTHLANINHPNAQFTHRTDSGETLSLTRAEWESHLGLPPNSLTGNVWYGKAFRESLWSPPIPTPVSPPISPVPSV